MKKITKIFSLFAVFGLMFMISACGTNNERAAEYVKITDTAAVTKGKQVIVVSQTTCPACNNFKGNVLQEMDKELQQKIGVIDIDKVEKGDVMKDIIEKYKVQYTPTLLLLDNGKLVKEYTAQEIVHKSNVIKIVEDFLK